MPICSIGAFRYMLRATFLDHITCRVQPKSHLEVQFAGERQQVALPKGWSRGPSTAAATAFSCAATPSVAIRCQRERGTHPPHRSTIASES